MKQLKEYMWVSSCNYYDTGKHLFTLGVSFTISLVNVIVSCMNFLESPTIVFQCTKFCSLLRNLTVFLGYWGIRALAFACCMFLDKQLLCSTVYST